MTKETKLIYAKIQRKFVKDAYDKVGGATYLTSIKAQYFIERLNDVFGPDGWHAIYDVTRDDENVTVVKCQLNLSHEHLTTSRQAYGAETKSKGKVEDVHKKAMTDSLKKACSHLGMGNEAFKGNINSDGTFKSKKAKDNYVARIAALTGEE